MNKNKKKQINPWYKLSNKAPYVLVSDKDVINGFNKEFGNNDDLIIKTELYPIPYLGNFEKADILLLQLNPGVESFPGLDLSEEHELSVYKDLKRDIIKNINHEQMDYPFYYLNPKYMLTGGFRYWARIFSSFIKTKSDYKKIANKVCCAEFFPYHSRKYRNINKILESQKYCFNLVKDFINNPNKMVILMRGGKEWSRELGVSRKVLVELNSKRNPVLNKKNFFKKTDFEIFIRLLNS